MFTVSPWTPAAAAFIAALSVTVPPLVVNVVLPPRITGPVSAIAAAVVW